MTAEGVAPEERAEERLRDLEVLTDAALAYLDFDDLLLELLDRVSDILDVDTAAVLLRNDASDELVATAARGIEAEVRQGVRVPMGKGFAGRIAAERTPVILDGVDATTVTNPLLWERGIRTMLGVPLVSSGEVIGVLHVGSLDARPFTASDAELLQLVADRVALATEARLTDQERVAARALERSFQPSALPATPPLEFAARYVPSARLGVGGDWYDAFELPSGGLCVVIGDAMGRGFRAASVMARLRTTVRTLAFEGAGATEVLELADRQMQHFEPGEMATVLLGIFDESRRSVWLSSAGHPPPVLVGPEKPATFVDVVSDPPLGVLHGIPRNVVGVHLPPDSVLFLYTDGLIERRDLPMDVALDRLREAISPGSPNSVCATIMQRLVGEEPVPDDIAILAVRRSGGTP